MMINWNVQYKVGFSPTFYCWPKLVIWSDGIIIILHHYYLFYYVLYFFIFFCVWGTGMAINVSVQYNV